MYYFTHSKYQKSAQDRHSPSRALHTSTVNLTCYKAQTIDAPKTLESRVCFETISAGEIISTSGINHEGEGKDHQREGMSSTH